MGKIKKNYLSEDYVKEIVNRHTVFVEDDWEISFHSPKTKSVSSNWSKLKTHISKRGKG